MATKKEKSKDDIKKPKSSTTKKKSTKKTEKKVTKTVDEAKPKSTEEEKIIIEESETKEVIDVKAEKTNTDVKIDDKPVVEEKIKDDLNVDDLTDIDDDNDELNEEEYDSLNIWEKFVKFEGDTKIGVATGIFILISHPILFDIQWVNHSWFIILIISFISLRYLNKQRLELEEDKPFEAKFANISFITVLVLLVLRDLAITSRLDDLFEIISR